MKINKFRPATRSFLSFCSIAVFFAFLSTAHADDQVQGYLNKTSHGMTFNNSNVARPYILKAGSPNIKALLDKMEDKDFISGTARIQSNNTLLLISIDFVGLRRLLGRWLSDEYFLSFHSFADMTSQTLTPERDFTKGDYKYAVAPGEGNNWKIFFTDQFNVSLGNLSLVDKDHFKVIFFDGKTGKTVKTLSLMRIQ
jgi:hypothetical protein